MESSSNPSTEDVSGATNQKKFDFKTGKRFWVLMVLGDLLILSVVYYFFFYSKSTSQSADPIARVVEKFDNSQEISPTPFPFQEMTIPYLRTKTYNSRLGELQMQSQASDLLYSAFVTSYASDGLRINGLLTKPGGEMPEGGFPAIVFIHGYIPPAQYSTTGAAYSSYVDYLARSGFVVFKIDLRGHGDSEGEPGGAYFSEDYIIDALNAYSALQNTDFVHPDRIGMWGHSMAGNVVLRSLAVMPSIKASSIWAGAVFTYTDREKYGINDASFQMSSLSPSRQSRRRELIEKYGEPSERSEFWKLVIPTNYLSDFNGAIQLNHAVDDTVVDVGYSRDLNALLDKTDVVHEFNEYQSGGHDIEGANFVEAMENTVAFFNKYLKAN